MMSNTGVQTIPATTVCLKIHAAKCLEVFTYTSLHFVRGLPFQVTQKAKAASL